MKRTLITTILFTVIFSLVSLYVIILGQGYQIEENGTVTSTSILRIRSTPENAVVYINDVKVNKVENRVEALTPGSTKVTLKSDGYTAWEKVINLKPGIVEDIYAQLYPERLTFERLTNKNVDQFYIDENSDAIIYTILKSEIPKDIGLWKIKLNRSLLDFSQNEPEKIFTFDATLLAKLNNYEIIISPNNSKAYLRFQDLKESYLLDLNNKSLVNITELIGFYPLNAIWFDGSNSLIFSTDILLSKFDTTSSQITLINYDPNANLVYGVGESLVYYFRRDIKKIFRYQNNTSTALDLPKLKIIDDELLEFNVSNESDRIFSIRGKVQNYFIDLNKDFTSAVQVNGELIKISPNSQITIEKTGETSYLASYYEENPDLKSYSIFTNQFTISKSLSLKDFSENGFNLLFIEENDVGKNLWISDYDGQNLVKVLSDELIYSENIVISASTTEIYLNLEDSSSSLTDSKVNNLYRFKLEID